MAARSQSLCNSVSRGGGVMALEWNHIWAARFAFSGCVLMGIGAMAVIPEPWGLLVTKAVCYFQGVLLWPAFIGRPTPPAREEE